MKKSIIFGVSLLSISLYGSEIMYSSSVKNLFETSDSTTRKGRLLPTSEVKILEKKGNRVKIEMEGYMKSGVSTAIYFVKGKRILVAGLSKSGNFDIKKISSSKDENAVEWEKVVLTAYTKNSNLTKDLDSLYSKAQELFKNNCSICHPAHPVNEFTANQWPSMFKAMVNRTAIQKQDRYLVTQYLQKHAKDMKGE
ncbi:cytochrome C [Halarcobacter anaerophilus]|uniref:Cytochrome C n=1 Tax=Halarcobacter anaerophilus TaxID=877500 RepID=A0A4Q0Y443_9BACT|nr:cytochrome C [Halarcobacter anaerophilus]QDF29283.1 molybdopterin-containing oxidoreductase II, DMSO/TMAO/BSO reductase family, monoheme c-type cytochrome [Halarcobacter anaerophilus]RXJ64533.1 cytochrome C [Halarcobacter anaerophilus]